MKHHVRGDVIAIERQRGIQCRALSCERGGHDFIGVEVKDPRCVKINVRMGMITLRSEIDKGVCENAGAGSAG